MHEHMHELCQCAARWSLYLQEPVHVLSLQFGPVTVYKLRLCKSRPIVYTVPVKKNPASARALGVTGESAGKLLNVFSRSASTAHSWGTNTL